MLQFNLSGVYLGIASLNGPVREAELFCFSECIPPAGMEPEVMQAGLTALSHLVIETWPHSPRANSGCEMHHLRGLLAPVRGGRRAKKDFDLINTHSPHI